jgi:sugar lactone lactonase YvrE
MRPTRPSLLPLLPLLPVCGGVGATACGPTEVLVGEAPGIARVVAGVLGTPFQFTFPDTAPGGDALNAPLGLPAGIAAFEDGSFYVADRGRLRVGHVTGEGAVSWPVGDGLCGAPGPRGADPLQLCFGDPGGVAVAPDGALYVTDPGAHRVYRYDPAADAVAVALGTGTAGIAADGALAATARTDTPEDVAIGPDGAVYVAESRNHRVVRIGDDGRLTVFAGSTIGDAGDGGPARAAQFRLPAGLAWMGDTLYLTDRGNQRIRRVIRDSVFSYAGLGLAGFGGDRGPAAAALFRDPGRLAVAGALLLVADRGNHRIRIIQVGPDSITTYGGTGSPVAGDDLLPIGETALGSPGGVAAAGRAVFVSDSAGAVVRRVVR